ARWAIDPRHPRPFKLGLFATLRSAKRPSLILEETNATLGITRGGRSPLPDGINLYQGEGNLGISFGEGKSLYESRSWDTDSIQASCNLLSTSDKPLIQTGRTFGVVADMGRIIEMKAKTNGHNTDLFGAKNMHIQLDPRKRFFENSGPALINDRLLEGGAEDDIPIAAVDSDFAIFTNEGFMRLKPAGADDE
ncbi:MAG: hypothetical protein K8U03_05490, partial [Planctomycetia bacterium]|nr:hypothetical protein [Planctomycetia bacterium]